MRFLTGQQQLLFENLRPKPAALTGTTEADADLSQSSAGMPTTSAGMSTTNDQRATTDMRTSSGHAADALSELIDLGDAPTCSLCGSIMTRNGSCYRCMSCGSTSGCS